MQWLNEPVSWQRTADMITVSVDPATDFWRETGYGYIRDSGHIYGEVLAGDLDVSVRVRGSFSAQFDQAGIMLRVDDRAWLKTGMEFFEGRARLSTVLTLGQSSWMVTDLPAGTDEITLRASRRGDAVEVRYLLTEDGPAELAALVYMPPGRELLAGVMCAAPEGPGFGVTFHDLYITATEWGQQPQQAQAEWGDEDAGAWAGEPAGMGAAGWEKDQPQGGEPGWQDDQAADWSHEPSGEREQGWSGASGDAVESAGEREDRWVGTLDATGEPADEGGHRWPSAPDDAAEPGAEAGHRWPSAPDDAAEDVSLAGTPLSGASAADGALEDGAPLEDGASPEQRAHPAGPSLEDASPESQSLEGTSLAGPSPEDAEPPWSGTLEFAPGDAAPGDAAPGDAAPGDSALDDTSPGDGASAWPAVPDDDGRPRWSVALDDAPGDGDPADSRDPADPLSDTAPRDTAPRDTAPRDTAPRDTTSAWLGAPAAGMGDAGPEGSEASSDEGDADAAADEGAQPPDDPSETARPEWLNAPATADADFAGGTPVPEVTDPAADWERLVAGSRATAWRPARHADVLDEGWPEPPLVARERAINGSTGMPLSMLGPYEPRPLGGIQSAEVPAPEHQEPEPQEPAPNGSVSHEPALGEPALREPTLGDPAPGDPAPGDPAPGESAPGDPAPQEPAPRVPEPADSQQSPREQASGHELAADHEPPPERAKPDPAEPAPNGQRPSGSTGDVETDPGPPKPTVPEPAHGRSGPFPVLSRWARSKQQSVEVDALPDPADEWISLLTADPAEE